jgi:hypothetical protein
MSRLMVRGSGWLDVWISGGWRTATDGGDEEFNVVLDRVDQRVVTEDGGRVERGEHGDRAARDLVWLPVAGDRVFVGTAGAQVETMELGSGIGSKE